MPTIAIDIAERGDWCVSNSEVEQTLAGFTWALQLTQGW